MLIALAQDFAEGHSFAHRLQYLNHFNCEVGLRIYVATYWSTKVPAQYMIGEVLIQTHLWVDNHLAAKACKLVLCLIRVIIVRIQQHRVDNYQGNFRRALAPLAQVEHA